MSQSSPSHNRRIEFGDGSYAYKNADGSSYYNDGNGYTQYSHPDPSQCWEQQPGQPKFYGLPQNMKDEEDEHDGDGYDSEGLYMYDPMDIDSEYCYPKYEQNSTNQQWAQKFEQDCSSPMPPQYARHSGPPRGSPDTLRQTPRRRRGTQEPRQANTQGSAPKRPLQTARRGGLSEQGGTRGRTQGSSAQPATTSGKSKKKASDVGGPTLIPGPDVAASPQDSKKAAAKADFSIKKPKKKTCSNCQVPGHDSRNCPLNKYGLGINQEKIKEELRKQEELKKQEESRKQELKRKEIEQEQASKAKAQAAKDASIKKAAKKKCSQCSVSGHDARNCPLNQYGLGKKAKDLSHEYHQETTTTTTTTTKTSASSKSTRGKVMSGRVERTAVKKKPTTKKK